MKKSLLNRVLISVAVAVLFTAICYSGILYKADNVIGDAIYYPEESHDGDIFIVGIDNQALDEFGKWPWSREVMAELINTLNADENARPAVIGIDVLYTGESDAKADEALKKAVEASGNVVLAEMTTIDSQMVVEDGNYYVDTFAYVDYSAVADFLKDVSEQGHINATPDKDGIIRHGLLYVENQKGEKVYSFNRVIYERYCQKLKFEINPMPEVNDRGAYLLPFTVKPGHFDEISVADVINGRVPGSFFANKIVLIAPYAAGLQDQYFTAIDYGEELYGIEIQANAINAYLNGYSLKQVSNLLQLVILFVLVAVCTWFFLGNHMKITIALWLVVSGLWVGACFVFRNNGLILHPTWVPIALSLSCIVAIIAHYVRVALEKKKVTDTFKRYVDPSVINELMREGTDSLGLGGKLVDIAALFVDIRGFTTMSEKLPAPEVVSILNRYLTLTTKCVMQNHGTLDKFVGDCTMAIWNAPLKQEDYIMNACKCALDMVEGAKELEKELFDNYGCSVSFGIGVNCGPAVVGNIGAEMRMDFTAIGDTINTAARLEANAPARTIYISRAVADALEGRIKTTSLGDTIKLKGKADGFEILTLDGLVEESGAEGNK